MGTRTALLLVGILLVLGLTVAATSASYPMPGDQTGYEPEQPIPFSHRLHAGELGIACRHCHAGAGTSPTAGIPPTDLCMGCHRFVSAPWADVLAEDERAKAEDRPARPVVSDGIRRLYRAMGLGDDGKPLEGAAAEPVPWVRVHDLPDHVFFDHRAHVSAGVDCATCHGAVEQLERVRQVQPLTMGWCVNCHRQSRALGILPDGRPSRASTDCSTCHF